MLRGLCAEVLGINCHSQVCNFLGFVILKEILNLGDFVCETFS